MNRIIFPPFLHKNDEFIILSPASKIDNKFIKGASSELKKWGFQPKLSKFATHSYGKYSGTVKERLSDLQKAMDDKNAKAILCSRGGYGAVHLIDKLDFTKFRRYPKWLIGFSDITALHLRFQSEGFASLHAPMARHLSVEPETNKATQYLREILLGKIPTYSIKHHKLNINGNAEGVLRGGNLAVAYGLRATPYDIPAENTILFFEDIGEQPHAIQRMFYNLKLSGMLKNISGLIIGQFTEYTEDPGLKSTVYQSIQELTKEYNIPVCFNFPVGHVSENWPLINGARVRFEVSNKCSQLTFLDTE